jgi:urease beta subunit
VALGGTREVFGHRGLVNGKLDREVARTNTGVKG